MDKPRSNRNRAYVVWGSMMQRCYSESYLTRKPTYNGCEVSEEFKDFDYFQKWCVSQKGFYEKDDNGISFCLDKDILSRENKVYSEDTCCFVPLEINNLFVSSKNSGIPKGVYRNTRGKPFRVRIYIDGERKGLGSYETIEDAFSVYKRAKEQRIKYFANKWKEFIDESVYDAMMNWDVRFDD